MPAPPEPAATLKGKVLIVEDEPDVLESTALLVEALGYEVVRLAEPAIILETIERERPALLLQDLHMPDLNVSGLVATLRADPSTTDLPIVFFSASRDVATTAARYDAWGYLQKPFSKAEMASLLARVLGPPADRPAAGLRRSMKREMRGAFHDLWDLIAAMSNYTELLQEARGLDEEGERCVRGLNESLLKLEARTDRLRAHVMSLVEALEPVPQDGEGRGGRAGAVVTRGR